MKLHLGDCLEIMPTIEAHSIDLILADLPYGITSCRWDSPIPLQPLWEQYRRVLKPKGTVVLTASQPFASTLVASNPKWFKCEWIWEKQKASNFEHAHFRPMRVHENVLVFCERQSTYNPQMTDLDKTYTRKTSTRKSPDFLRANSSVTHIVKGGNYVGRYPRSIQRFTSEGMNRGSLHPTQKPVALMEYLIRTYSNEDEVIMDNTMGSGTTGVAAWRAKRAFVGIEKDEAFYKVAELRIANEMAA